MRMVLAGFACLIHAVLPFLFVRTGSRAISELNERMVSRRRRCPASRRGREAALRCSGHCAAPGDDVRVGGRARRRRPE